MMKNKQLSKNFTLQEFTESRTAKRLGIDNSPPEDVIRNLKKLCLSFLQPLRDHYRKPVLITSGYRSEELNRRVGGVPDSLHKTGEAADFKVVSYKARRVFYQVPQLKFDYEELILYPDENRLHVAISDENSGELWIEEDGEYIKP